MKAIRRLTVRPALPERLGAVVRLMANLRWSWHEPTQRLFQEIAPEGWLEHSDDMIALLASIDPDRLERLAADDAFVERADALLADLNAYLTEPRWYQGLEGEPPRRIAYFSPEFGLTAAIPQYSGGLGILAGDHLKSASDLGVPVVAVGLFYRGGYFRQSISGDGWQQESYPVIDPDGLPLRVLRRPDGGPVVVTLALPDDGTLSARVWEARVGRVTLLLLDSDIPENTAELCTVTDRLYSGGEEHRLRQELLLGIGGVRAIAHWCELRGMSRPEVFHTNEGHAGFLGVERVSGLVAGGLTFAEALTVVRASTVFTTHTPVPAGIDRFPASVVRRYLDTDILPAVETDDVMALGAEEGAPDVFNMAHMGLRIAQRANGVSTLHGEVSRRMFGSLWPGFDPADVPIGSITNGVHAPTWTNQRIVELAERDGGWDAVPDAELWDVLSEMREALVHDARRRSRRAWQERNPGGVVPSWIGGILDPGVLTIGFARRVPTYKRLTLMLHDRDRLKRLLLDPERPIQIVVAGKAHPADDGGKRLIQEFVEFASDPEIRHRVVFLPDYDMTMAKTLYPGTDVWLNNPTRPLEACGTSGMKAAMGGSLNLSILDGWWDEYADGENGWAIPSAVAPADDAERDRVEAASLYDLIEHEIAPRFYDRGEDGIPSGWLERVRHTLSDLAPRLTADRMVTEYVERMYRPAAESGRRMIDGDYAGAHRLAEWTDRVRAAWPGVSITHVESGGLDAVPTVGDVLRLRAYVVLGSLTPEDVSVQVVHGTGRSDGEIEAPVVEELSPEAVTGDTTVFSGSVVLPRAGIFGYSVRIVPRHELLASPAELALIAVAR